METLADRQLKGARETAAHAALGEEASFTGSRTDGNQSAFSGNVAHQRRRVNPESLALRLGPDLVRDLDALITPGNTEMPSFAVRKELQERYNIDRRHIYDYFHSRGLRVVKEDKHGNPLAVKDLPTALPNLRPQRQAPATSSRSHTSHPVALERKLFKPRGITKARPGRPRKNPPANPEIVPSTIGCDSTDTNTGAAPAATYVSVNPLLLNPHASSKAEEDKNNSAFNTVVNPLDESFSVSRAIGDVAYAYRHKLVFERMQELAEFPAKLALTEDRLHSTSPCSASSKGLLLPHVKPLTRDERRAIYETLSDSLGPAHGMQEFQGTYKKHMEARAKLYFEGLLSVPPHHTQLQPAKTSTLLDRQPHLGTNEFRHWLSETRFLKRDGTHGSPRLHPNYRNANVAKQKDVDGVADKQSKQRHIPHWTQTLDEMFPMPLDDSNDGSDAITDSPVVHKMRKVTRMTARAQDVDVADECNAGDHVPFSVAATPSLPVPISPVASAAETRHADIHGLAGFPGPQEVEISVAEMELQWPEPIPYTSRSGRGAALAEMQRRGRNMSNARIRRPSCSPRKHQMRDLDGIWTRPVTSRDARRRTPSAAGGI